MTNKPSPPAPPPPEIVDQALALLLTAMEQGRPGDENLEYMESKVTHLDRLAWRHQVAGEALQVAAQKRATLFRRQRNALIPISRLPLELLSAILISFVDDHVYKIHRIKALQTLAQVAWQWWQTIKSDPQFWTHIIPPMEGVELQIRRAGILPLHLDWTNDADCSEPTDHRSDDADSSDDKDPTDWDALGYLVQRHARRWIGIELEHYHSQEACLQVLCTSHFPHLKYLRVYVSHNARKTSKNWSLNLAQCQNLQELHFPIMPYLPVTPSSNSPLHLQTLHLDLFSMTSCSSHDLESLLRLTPQLVELNVENLLRDTNPPAPFDAPIIDLPNLQWLEFNNAFTGDEQEWIPLLAQIRAPQLEFLELFYGPSARISARVVFTVLATWPAASTNRPEDAPLHSVLRKVEPSAAWRVISGQAIYVSTKDSGSAGLDITLKYRHSSRDELSEDILSHLAQLGLPVDLYVSAWAGETELGFWDGVLDATPSLRTFEVAGSLQIYREVMNSLSTKTPSSSSTSPRAPHLEKLSFQFNYGGSGLWLEGNAGEAVKAMLDIRRESFIQDGVQDPPKLVVTGPTGRLFDEAEGRWLDSESSDAQRGSEAVPEEELTMGDLADFLESSC